MTFENQWNLNKHKQKSGFHLLRKNSSPLFFDLGIQKAWELVSQSTKNLKNDFVIAVVDSGFSLHEDLISSLWENPGEIPQNGIDDDKNGLVDDIHGFNFIENIPTFSEENNHGTKVLSVMASKRWGTMGIAPHIKYMLLNSFSKARSQNNYLKAYKYIIEQKKLYLDSNGRLGANIIAVNNSFVIPEVSCHESLFMKYLNAIYDKMGKLGILNILATSNNTDDVKYAPTDCPSDYTVVVSNSNKNDQIYRAGAHKVIVDLAAPGYRIKVLDKLNDVKEVTGSSLAAPHVSATIALMHTVASENFKEFYQQSPDQAALELKNILLENVDQRDNLTDKVSSGGRLNIYSPVKIISEF